jgi:hypothetical protein
MWDRGARREHGHMDAAHVHLTIDITTDGHTIVGTVTSPGRAPAAFSGRLGIIRAIDAAIAAIDPPRDAEPDEV